jgi:hypothetical protein
MTRRGRASNTAIDDRVAAVLLAEQLEAFLDQLSRRKEHVLVAHIALNIPAGVIAERLGIGVEEVRDICTRAMDELQFFSYFTWTGFLPWPEEDEFWCARTDRISRIAAEYGLGTPVSCGYEPCSGQFLRDPSARGGRPRRYCSPACRTAACRARKRQRDG